MNTIRTLLKFKSDRRAVTALEYGMIAALVAVVAITGFKALGSNLNGVTTNVAGSISGG
jgi:pilus assembly protein Flp/PilA